MPDERRSHRYSSEVEDPSPAGADRGTPAPLTGPPDEIVAGLEEVTDLRWSSGRVFETPEGSAHIAQMFLEPIHYRDEGRWKRIDSGLVDSNGDFTNRANSDKVTFPNKLGTKGVTIRFRKGGSLTSSLQGAAKVRGEVDGSSVTYREAFADVDVRYSSISTGYKEDLLLRSRNVRTSFAYLIDAEGLTLDQDDGGIAILRNGVEEARIPQIFAYDSADMRGETELTTELKETAAGTYRLEISLDEGWLNDETRAFPVVIDPSVVDSLCGPQGSEHPCNPDGSEGGVPLLKDVSVINGGGLTNPGNNTLAVGFPPGTGEARTFMTFDLRQEVRHLGDLIYRGSFSAYTNASTGPFPHLYRIHRIVSDWSQFFGWGTQPAVDTGTIWGAHDGCPDAPPNAACSDPGYMTFGIHDLVQHWIDNLAGSNHGFRLIHAAGGGTRARSFRSGEWPEIQKKPYLLVYVNAMPDTRNFVMDDPSWPYMDVVGPAYGSVTENDAPTLEIEDLTDVNGDPIVVRYQVSREQNDFTPTNLVYDSGWIDETSSHTLPPGQLAQGTYYWRVQASDLCLSTTEQDWSPYVDLDNDPGDPPLCDDLDRGRPTTQPSRLTVVEKRRGHDPRWSMWQQALGNDMSLRVDEANGNMVLEYPLDSLATPAGDLELSLSYNGHKALDPNEIDNGLPPGWELSAGSSARPLQIPVRLEPLGDNAVAAVLSSGRRDIYVRIAPNTFSTAGPGAGVIHRSEAGGYNLETHSGGLYSFDHNGSLMTARASTSSATAPGFDYHFSGSPSRLYEVSDPLGRDVTVTYEPQGADEVRITTWDQRTWTINQSPSGDRVTSITDPTGDTVAFDYAANDLIGSIKDARAMSGGGPGTTLTYSPRTSIDGSSRPLTATVKLPGHSHSWGFDFTFAAPDDSYAATTEVTDPRGAATGGIADDFKRIVDHDELGFPIKVRGPQVPGSGWPVSKYLWDEHGNKICERGPAANLANDISCLPPDDGGSDALQTSFVYQHRAPYLLRERTGPAPSSGSGGERLVTIYRYDEGFTGLQAHRFSNQYLSGLPQTAEVVATVNEGSVSQPVGHSSRFFGEIDPSGPAGDYVFKVVATGSARLAVGSEILLDCITISSGTCPSNREATFEFGDGPRHIFLDYKHSSPSDDLELRWKPPGASSFDTVPTEVLLPDVDALTSTQVTSKERIDQNDPPLAETTLDYDGFDYLRRLPTTTTLNGANTPTARSVDYTYEQDFGRLLTETDATGVPITHHYFDPTSNFATQGVCEDTTTHRAGLTVTRTCTPAGDIATETAEVGGNLAADDTVSTQTRTTQYAYDPLGRVTSVDHADGGRVTYDYFPDGLLESETLLVSGGSTPVTRTTSYEYRPDGMLSKQTLPDPDPADGNPAPTIDHDYDEVGNAISMTDERNKTWTYTYNDVNLRTSKTVPGVGTSEFSYDAAMRLTQRKAPLVTSEGERDLTSFTYDVLGRRLTKKIGTLAPTTYTYDPRGLVVSETDPDGVEVAYSYDAAGDLRSETAPVGAGGSDVTRALVYDASGYLVSEEDFRHNETHYQRDAAGRVTKVTLAHASPNETLYVYNEAGETEKTTVPRGSEPALTWAGDYDLMGRLKAERDGLGNSTTYDHNLAGELRTSADPRGITVTSTYDGAGRQTERVATDSTGEIERSSFAYDDAGNIKLASNASGAIGMTYDDSGRLASVTGVGGATTYDYSAHRLTSVTDPAGTTTYGYDDATRAGRIDTVTDPVTGLDTTITYEDSGRLATRTDPAGALHTYAYDPAGRRTQDTVTVGTEEIASFTQAYDRDSHVTSRTQDIDGSTDNGTWAYTYDGAGRLTSATDPQDMLATYGYDAAGNRTLTRTEPAPAVVPNIVVEATTTYDAASRPTETSTSVTTDGGTPEITTTTYDHDPAGNLTEIQEPPATWTYSYDGFSRMYRARRTVAGLPAPVSSDIVYDALDRTLDKDTTLTTELAEVTLHSTAHRYRGLGEDLATTTTSIDPVDDVTSITTRYGLGPATTIAQETTIDLAGVGLPDDVATHVLGTGAHHDVTYLLDTSATVVGTKTYDPWGELRSATGADSYLGFQGDPTDDDTTLVDMGARHYLPGLGRFLTQDPLRGDPLQPLSTNPYIYGGDDPVSMWDPTGLKRACATNNQTCDASANESHSKPQVASAGSALAVDGWVGGSVGMIGAKPSLRSVMSGLSMTSPSSDELLAIADELVSALGVSAEAGAALRYRIVSELARQLRSGTRAERSKAARLLPQLGRLTRLFENRGLRVAGKGAPLISGIIQTVENLRAGQPAEEAAGRAGLQVGGGVLGGAAGAGVACTAGAAVTGGATCVGFVLFGGGLGSFIGEELGDIFFRDYGLTHHYDATQFYEGAPDHDFYCSPDSAFRFDGCP